MVAAHLSRHRGKRTVELMRLSEVSAGHLVLRMGEILFERGCAAIKTPLAAAVE